MVGRRLLQPTRRERRQKLLHRLSCHLLQPHMQWLQQLRLGLLFLRLLQSLCERL